MRHVALALALLAASAAAQEEYSIGAGDVLHVAVLGQPEMTGDFAVSAEGFLSFPFVGKVKLAGLTPDAAEQALVALLADGYLKQPRVAVTVKEVHSQRVFVTGEVQHAGPYGLRSERSLLALLAEVGELTANAGHEVIVVRPPKQAPAESATPDAARPVGLPGDVPGATIVHLSLRELRSGNPEKDFRLAPGDTVFVPKAAQFYVTGQVARAGGFRFEEGITIFQALNLAGGVTPRGSAKGVRVIRMVDGKRSELKVGPGDLVQPEDTLLVPERFF